MCLNHNVERIKVAPFNPIPQAAPCHMVMVMVMVMVMAMMMAMMMVMVMAMVMAMEIVMEIVMGMVMGMVMEMVMEVCTWMNGRRKYKSIVSRWLLK